MKNIYTIGVFLLVMIVVSCKEKRNEQALLYLEMIQGLYDNKEYTEALEKIDSIQILFPKAFQEIKAGLSLQKDIRRAYNEKQVADCDSLLITHKAKTDSIKKFFIYKKDKEDPAGVFIPRSVSAETLTSTMLKAGVNEAGTMYIESVYIGGQLHNAIKVSTKNKEFAESLPVTDDGFVHRFSNLGKQYEVIKVTKFHDNGLAEFICKNANYPLTVTLKGKNVLSYSLANIQKKAIIDSYALSNAMILQDSLELARDKALTLIKYLDSKENKSNASE